MLMDEKREELFGDSWQNLYLCLQNFIYYKVKKVAAS